MTARAPHIARTSSPRDPASPGFPPVRAGTHPVTRRGLRADLIFLLDFPAVAIRAAGALSPLSGGASRPCRSGRSGVAAHRMRPPSAAAWKADTRQACRGGTYPATRSSNRPLFCSSHAGREIDRVVTTCRAVGGKPGTYPVARRGLRVRSSLFVYAFTQGSRAKEPVAIPGHAHEIRCPGGSSRPSAWRFADRSCPAETAAEATSRSGWEPRALSPLFGGPSTCVLFGKGVARAERRERRMGHPSAAGLRSVNRPAYRGREAGADALDLQSAGCRGVATCRRMRCLAPGGPILLDWGADVPVRPHFFRKEVP